MFNTNIPFYLIFIILAIICGLLIIYRNAMYLNFRKEETIGLLFYVTLGAIFGAKYFTFFVNFKKYDGVFDFMQIGLSSYGSVIGIIFILFLFAKQYKKEFKSLICIVLSSFPLMYAVGKIGCFLAGCCYGIHYQGLFNITYSYSYFAPKGISLFPIQLLEAIVFFVIFMYTFSKLHKLKESNIFIGKTFIVCGIAKFILDYLRYCHVGVILSINQVLSIIFIIIGLFFILKQTIFSNNN